MMSIRPSVHGPVGDVEEEAQGAPKDLGLHEFALCPACLPTGCQRALPLEMEGQSYRQVQDDEDKEND